MKINLALLLLAATYSANAVEITLDFEETEAGPCRPEPWSHSCGLIDGPFHLYPTGSYDYLGTRQDSRDPSGTVLTVDDEFPATFSFTGNAGSNISSFAVQSFDVFLPDGISLSMRPWPLNEQDRQLITGLPKNEWSTVTLTEPVYVPRAGFQVTRQGDINGGSHGFFDNIAVDFVWGAYEISSVTDLSSDGQPDFTLLPLWGPPTVSGVDSADGITGFSYRYLDDQWQPLAHDVVIDGNGDGVADDPLVADLVQNLSSGEIAVEVRTIPYYSPTEEWLNFFNDQYEAIDVAVIDDTNGDGVPDDPSIAVMAEKPSTGRQAIMLKRLSDGALLDSWTITRENQELIALADVSLPGGNSMISVLGRDSVTGKTTIHSIRIADGERLPKQTVFGANMTPRDLAIQADGDGNGIEDDPIHVVLSEKVSNGKQMASLSDALTGAPINEFRVLNANWTAHSIAISPDLSGDGFPDLLTAAIKKENGRLVVNVRELNSGDRVKNLFPVIPNPAK